MFAKKKKLLEYVFFERYKKASIVLCQIRN